MIAVAGRAERVLLDASPFFRFAEAGRLLDLAGYLGARASRTAEVQVELDRNAARVRELKTLALLRFPPGDPLVLPVPLQDELLQLKRANARPGDHPTKDLGELSTYLMARELGSGVVVVMDDRLSVAYLRRRGMPRVSSAGMAAEMTAAGALTPELGLQTFRAAAPPDVGEREFLARVEQARQALR